MRDRKPANWVPLANYTTPVTFYVVQRQAASKGWHLSSRKQHIVPIVSFLNNLNTMATIISSTLKMVLPSITMNPWKMKSEILRTPKKAVTLLPINWLVIINAVACGVIMIYISSRTILQVESPKTNMGKKVSSQMWKLYLVTCSNEKSQKSIQCQNWFLGPRSKFFWTSSWQLWCSLASWKIWKINLEHTTKIPCDRHNRKADYD